MLTKFAKSLRLGLPRDITGAKGTHALAYYNYIKEREITDAEGTNAPAYYNYIKP